MVTMLRHREFTCAVLIDTLGRFLLQQRDNVPGIVHPGKIGLFGGHRECGETYLQCIVREVHEELSYFIPPERFEYLATNGQSLHTRRHWFEAKNPSRRSRTRSWTPHGTPPKEAAAHRVIHKKMQIRALWSRRAKALTQ